MVAVVAGQPGSPGWSRSPKPASARPATPVGSVRDVDLIFFRASIRRPPRRRLPGRTQRGAARHGCDAGAVGVPTTHGPADQQCGNQKRGATDRHHRASSRQRLLGHTRAGCRGVRVVRSNPPPISVGDLVVEPDERTARRVPRQRAPSSNARRAVGCSSASGQSTSGASSRLKLLTGGRRVRSARRRCRSSSLGYSLPSGPVNTSRSSINRSNAATSQVSWTL